MNKCPYMMQKKRRHGERRGEGCEKMEAETRVMWPQAEEC